MSKYFNLGNRTAVRRSRRTLQFENLELRRLMAAEIFSDTRTHVWERLPSLPAEQPGAKSYLNVSQYTAWSIDQYKLKTALEGVPREFTQEAMSNSFIFSLPTPDGVFSRFELYEAPIMEPALAAQFPDIKTYRGQGIDDPAATLRFDVSHLGFRAQVLSPNGAYYIDPYWHLSDRAYVSYYKKDLGIHPDKGKLDKDSDVVSYNDPSLLPGSGSSNPGNSPNGSRGSGSRGSESGATPTLGRSGTQLRTYRLANAATGEFTRFHGGSVANGQAAIVTSINRVTGIYETELAVRLVLVANNSSLVYTDPATDPYTNNNGGALLGENQRNVDSVIGDANYDIGHVFGTGGGGLALLGVVGVSGRKAQGQTGSPQPTGDAFDVDYVAHEIGHQFGGNHTFNGTNGSCGGNRAASAAYEPGSGTTIMAYAGICGSDDIQPNSDPYFHSRSFDEIVTFTTTGVGNSAAVITNTGNNVPRVQAGRDYVIPAATPFELDSVGRDVDPGTALTYQWEQRDLGPGQALSDPDNGSSPLFRSWKPSGTTSRTFPRMAELLNNTTPRGERLPTTNRTLNFRAVVRDNFGGGGGVNTDDLQITVVDTGAPFAVTSPNTAVNLAAQSSQTVTWNVANTNNAPISESQVDIWMSVDGGRTFPILLAGPTPNDGSESIVLPNVTSAQARIKIAAHNGIFFDISNENFSIVGTTNTAPTISSIQNIWIPWNTSTPAIPFQVADAETDVSQLTVTAFSSNETLVPSSRIEITGSGANRNVRVRPSLREFGESQIYVGVTDDNGVTTYEKFLIYVEANTSTDFGISFTETDVNYTEDTPPVSVSPTAIIIDKLPGNYAGGSLTVDIQPAGRTDQLSLGITEGAGISQLGSLIYYNNVHVANKTSVSNSKLQFDFNLSTGVDAIEAIARAIRFEATGDAPDTSPRSIAYMLIKGSRQEINFIAVKVESINDSPVALAVSMDPIDEDTPSSNGTTVAQLIDRGVFDPDLTQATGIILTGVADTTGRWQYSTGTTWRDLPSVSPQTGLVLRSTSRLRFIPDLNFFGNAPSLRYYALDDNYRGGFSSSATPVFANIAAIVVPSSISARDAEIRQVVRPVNDAPVASTPFPSQTVNQDAPLSFTVPSSLFSDIDDAVLTWSARSAKGGSLPSWISFDSASRTFTGTPRNSDVGLQQFVIRATDAGGLFAEAPFTVDVINVNDAPYDIRLVGQPVPENIFGARIGRLTAIDPDPNDSLTWAVIDNRFEVRGSELYLLSQSSFDFESERSVKVKVRATDNGRPLLSVETEITVQVADVNEFAPQLLPLNLSVKENASGGAVVGRATATDADTANQVKYRFFGTPPSQFLLDSMTGIISLKPGVALNFETAPSYKFFVEAFDDGTPLLSTWVSTTVSVEDVNEFSPTITTQSFTVAENQPVGLTFGRVLATDGDKQAVTFSLLPDETRFSIDPATGDLSLTRTDILDFERSRTEVVTVIATDNGSPSLSSQRQIVLQVTNANEPPTAVSVPVTQVLANISGLSLGRITVQDPDGPTQYNITSLDNRIQVVGGDLVFRPGQSFRDTDPQFIQVPLLLNDVDGGISYQFEIQLERLLNPNPWQNTASPFDVNRSGSVDPLDVLAIINAINGNSNPNLPIPRDQSSFGSGDVDVDGDGKVTPLDVLAVVNRINNNQNRGEGESPSRETRSEVDNYFAQYDLEFDPLQSRTRRLRR